MRDAAPEVDIGLHLHDTYGTALANAWVGMEEGVTRFDSAAGGTGGCPFALGAAGNIATEDLVFVCHASHIETGIDLEKLNSVARKLVPLLGHPLESRQSRIRVRSQATLRPRLCMISDPGPDGLQGFSGSGDHGVCAGR